MTLFIRMLYIIITTLIVNIFTIFKQYIYIYIYTKFFLTNFSNGISTTISFKRFYNQCILSLILLKQPSHEQNP